MNQIERGQAHLARGEFDLAVAAFQAGAQAERSVRACVQLGLGLALAGRWDELLRLVEGARPPVLLFHKICLKLMEHGAYRVLGQLHHRIPESHIVTPLALYFAGVALISDRRFAESLAYFDRFKLLVLHNFDHFRPLLSDQGFNVAFRQGTLVEPLAYVGALDDGSRAVGELDPEVRFEQRAGAGHAPLLFACCLNDLYFARFAESLVATLQDSSGAADLHFHVVGSQQDCRPLFEALERRYPGIALGLSLEPDPPVRHAVYYACNRFVVLPRLAAHYDRDIMMLDADGLVKRDLKALYQLLLQDGRGPDFACFETGRTEPASVYQATLMYFANTPGCRAFVRLLRRFVCSKLCQPPEVTWMLDQAALFSVSHYLEHGQLGNFEFQRLDQLTGADLSKFVDSAGNDAEKNALGRAGYLK